MGQHSDDLEANIPDLWQTAAEDEEAEDKEDPTPLLEIWEDKATLTFLKDGQYDVDRLPDNQADMSKAMKRINKRAAAFYWNHQGNTLHKHATPRYPNDREVPPP
jgi:hypothetical protein